MTIKPIDITGRESVYCINEQQLHTAYDLADSDPESGPRIQSAVEELEGKLNRNELAAVAFVLIDRLLENATV